MAKVKKRRLADLVDTRGPLEGECNICGVVGRLTEDHAPPRSCRGIQAAEMHRLHVRLTDGAVPKGRLFQNGPHFRTICARCNNQLLGVTYDPALAHFCAEVRRAADSTLLLPPQFDIQIQPQLVIRSVLGHLAAMGVGRYRKGAITESLRDYMLDGALPLPHSIRMYYWLYTSPVQVMVRDAAILILPSKTTFVMWLMKFFPLAFLVTFDEPQERQFKLPDLDSFGQIPLASQQLVPVYLRPVIHTHWPEAPTDDHILLFGNEAVTSLPRELLRRA